MPKVTAIGMALLLSGTIISPAVPALADVDISGEKDDMKVKTYLYEIAYSPENRLEDEDGRLRISGWVFYPYVFVVYTVVYRRICSVTQ